MYFNAQLYPIEKGKKLHKIASKLNPRKKGVAKYKVVQEKLASGGDALPHPQQYQSLINSEL